MVGSAAVIIGAMLVAPLMRPIVGLAMGVATGSPVLMLRAAARVGASLAVVVLGAAVITLLLPFHELNAELRARTSPTVLDLVTASFCAVAGVYAALRPGSDTATTAAGTSIGVSLVPPLCASAYGLGTLAWPVARGTMSLFLTNLVAIVVVGTLAFLALGLSRVSVPDLERVELETSGVDPNTSFAGRRSTMSASRWGPALRLLLPIVMLSAIYVPLRRALGEAAWEIRARGAGLTPQVPAPPPTLRAESATRDEALERAGAHVRRVRPELAAGPPLGVHVALSDAGPLSIALPRVLTRGSSDVSFVRDVSSALRTRAFVTEPLHLCIGRPEAAKNARRVAPKHLELETALDAMIAGQPDLKSTSSQTWTLTFTREPCGLRAR